MRLAAFAGRVVVDAAPEIARVSSRRARYCGGGRLRLEFDPLHLGHKWSYSCRALYARFVVIVREWRQQPPVFQSLDREESPGVRPWSGHDRNPFLLTDYRTVGSTSSREVGGNFLPRSDSGCRSPPPCPSILWNSSGAVSCRRSFTAIQRGARVKPAFLRPRPSIGSFSGRFAMRNGGVVGLAPRDPSARSYPFQIIERVSHRATAPRDWLRFARVRTFCRAVYGRDPGFGLAPRG